MDGWVVVQIHIDFFIALLFDCARMKLRIRHVETRQTLINVIGGRNREGAVEQLPSATTIRQHLPATDRDMPVKMWAQRTFWGAYTQRNIYIELENKS